MGRFSNLVSGDSISSVTETPQIQEVVPAQEVFQVEEVLVEEVLEVKEPVISEEDLPATPEEAIEKNLLFSKKKYLKQFEPPQAPPKELNPGQSLFRHKLLEKPTVTTEFTSKPSIRSTKDPEPPFVPVKYNKPKTLRRTVQEVPVEEVAQEDLQAEQEDL